VATGRTAAPGVCVVCLQLRKVALNSSLVLQPDAQQDRLLQYFSCEAAHSARHRRLLCAATILNGRFQASPQQQAGARASRSSCCAVGVCWYTGGGAASSVSFSCAPRGSLLSVVGRKRTASAEASAAPGAPSAWLTSALLQADRPAAPPPALPSVGSVAQLDDGGCQSAPRRTRALNWSKLFCASASFAMPFQRPRRLRGRLVLLH